MSKWVDNWRRIAHTERVKQSNPSKAMNSAQITELVKLAKKAHNTISKVRDSLYRSEMAKLVEELAVGLENTAVETDAYTVCWLQSQNWGYGQYAKEFLSAAEYQREKFYDLYNDLKLLRHWEEHNYYLAVDHFAGLKEDYIRAKVMTQSIKEAYPQYH